MIPESRHRDKPDSSQSVTKYQLMRSVWKLDHWGSILEWQWQYNYSNRWLYWNYKYFGKNLQNFKLNTSRSQRLRWSRLIKQQSWNDYQKSVFFSWEEYIQSKKLHKDIKFVFHKVLYTVKKRFASFPSPAGMSPPNSPWAGIMTS